MKKILHIIGNLEVGGAEADLIAKTIALKDQYQFQVLTLLQKGALAERLEKAGIEVIAGGMKHKMDVGAVLRMIRIVRRERPDLIHAHMFYSYLIAHIMRLLGLIRHVVYTIQKEAARANWLEIQLEKLLRPHTARILASSQQVLTSYRKLGVNGRNMIPFYNSIDFSRFASGRNLIHEELGFGTTPVIGTVGRLLPVKGHRYLIEALPDILQAYPDLKCVIIGDGDEKNALVELAEKLKVTEAVCWLGARRDIENFIPYLDIFVMPSLSEAFGIAAAEASACGVPVVASAVGGLPEVIVNGTTGVLVPPGNAKAISKEVKRLLSEEQTRIAMGLAGKNHVRKFSAEEMACQLAAVYDSVAG
ncbi:MAG: glycosyltransferase [Firmicutes bacterium]|nr:glycosyltransferase [Bacillota bacterium]